MSKTNPMVIVLAGVAGTGKTTVGQALAQGLGWDFFDADTFQPAANVEKMRTGKPLDDLDRAPWLAALRTLIAQCLVQKRHAVLAASLLKKAYRDTVGIDHDRVKLVYLHADPELIRQRLEHRSGHFMAASMLDSQLAILEVPVEGVQVNAAQTLAQIVTAIRHALRL